MKVIQSLEVVEGEFYDSLHTISHSDKTIQTYKTSINHLRKFLKEKHSCNEIELVKKINANELDVYHFLKQLVIYLDNKKVGATGIRTYLSGIKGYLRNFGIRINSDDFKQFVKIPKIIKTHELPLDKELLNRVLHNVPPKLQVVILVATSSGLRIGELVRLKISDIDFNSNPTKISIRANIAKGKMARETFITQEATLALKDYLKSNFGWQENRPNQDTYVFGKTTNKGKKPKSSEYNPASSAMALQSSLLYYLRKTPDLQTKNENGYHSIHFHAFRKFCRTTVGNICGRDFAESLLGHRFYMDTYYQLSEEEKIEFYNKVESYLTISDFKRIEDNQKELTSRQVEYEKKLADLTSYLSKNSIQIPSNFHI